MTYFSKHCQKLDIFFKKIDKNCHFFRQNCPFFPEADGETATADSPTINKEEMSEIGEKQFDLLKKKTKKFMQNFGHIFIPEEKDDDNLNNIDNLKKNNQI